MPRDGLGQYSPPPGINGITNYTIESTKYNAYVADVTQDLNLPRPIVVGGTGASSVDGALDNLSAEKFKQVVTDWTTNVWRAGSFYAATTATGAAPIPGKAFAGIAYYANATDFVIEATNLTDPGGVKYIRTQTAGVWSAWNTVDTTRKNYIINGAMMVSQENGGTAGSTAGYYPVDMFSYAGVTGSEVVSIVQAIVGTPAGSPNRFRVSVTTGAGAPAAGKVVHIATTIEGYRSADLYVNGPKTVTLRFGVKAPQGTYCVSFRGVGGRSYVAEYIIAVGEHNIETVKSVTLTMDNPSGWNYGNGAGILVSWTLACGTTYQTTPGFWTNGNFLGSSNQRNFFDLSGNVFELFDVSLTEGTVAPPFVVPDYASELAACQRYYEHTWPNGVAGPPISANGMDLGFVCSGPASALLAGTYVFKTIKRAAPTVTIYDGAGLANQLSYYVSAWANGGAALNLVSNDKRLNILASAVNLIACSIRVNARL